MELGWGSPAPAVALHPVPLDHEGDISSPDLGFCTCQNGNGHVCLIWCHGPHEPLPAREEGHASKQGHQASPLLSEQHTEDFWKHSEFFKEPPPHCDVGNYVYPSLFISVPFQALEWFSSANSVFA